MSVTLFVAIDESLTSIMADALTFLKTQPAAMAIGVLTGSYTLYILWHGFMVLSGKIEAPAETLLWNLGRLLLVFTFVSNLDGWLDLTINAIDGLKEAVTGASNPFQILDNLVEQQIGAIVQLWDATDVGANIAAAFLLALTCLIMIASLIIFMIPAFIILFMNTLTLKILLATAPLFIFCLSYGFLRTMFNNWLQLIFSNILTLMFLSAFIRVFDGIFGVVLLKSSDNIYSSMFLIAIGYLAMGFIASKTIQLCVSLGSQLAGASVESTSAAASAAGIANRAAARNAAMAGQYAGAAVGKTYKVGRSLASAAGETISNLSNSAYLKAATMAASILSKIGKR